MQNSVHHLLRPHMTARTRSSAGKPPPWKKLLYLKQPYPDNYTDKSFLSQLKRNSTVAKYSYVKLIGDFSLIVFHLSSLLVVVLTFAGIYLHKWNSTIAAIVSTVLSVIGFTIKLYIDCSKRSTVKVTRSQDANSVKPYFLLIFMLAVLSPALKSLTRSTSSDSIWALSVVLFIANTLLHDYGMITPDALLASSTSLAEIEYKPVISTNLAFSNSIVLASRLISTSQVFAFVLFAIQTNILLPLFDFYLRRHSYMNLHHFVWFGIFQTASCLIYTLLGLNVLLVWWLCTICILFVMPAYFLYMQRYKNELQGPWDPAKPLLKTD